MTKEELKNICHSSANEILKNEWSKEELCNRISKYSSNGKTLSADEQAIFSLIESLEFTEKLIYNVLCKVLRIEE